ncbi:MAG: hypothetical protein HOH24_03995 [Chromatiales bacterium]|jgi:hypothetical protein|nr:hypothetical protein [Chromatiales bacterium]
MHVKKLIAKNNDGEFPYREVRSMIDCRWVIEAHGTEMMPVLGCAQCGQF